jgi:hypothetical protein
MQSAPASISGTSMRAAVQRIGRPVLLCSGLMLSYALGTDSLIVVISPG